MHSFVIYVKGLFRDAETLLNTIERIQILSHINARHVLRCSKVFFHIFTIWIFIRLNAHTHATFVIENFKRSRLIGLTLIITKVQNTYAKFVRLISQIKLSFWFMMDDFTIKESFQSCKIVHIYFFKVNSICVRYY